MPFRFGPLRSQVLCESITGEWAEGDDPPLAHQRHPARTPCDDPGRDYRCRHSAGSPLAFPSRYRCWPRVPVGSGSLVHHWLLLVLAALVSTQSTAQALFQRDDHCQEYGGRNRSDGPISDRIRCVGLDADSSASSYSCRYRCACASPLACAFNVLSGRLLLGVWTDIKAALDVD